MGLRSLAARACGCMRSWRAGLGRGGGLAGTTFAGRADDGADGWPRRGGGSGASGCAGVSTDHNAHNTHNFGLWLRGSPILDTEGHRLEGKGTELEPQG